LGGKAGKDGRMGRKAHRITMPHVHATLSCVANIADNHRPRTILREAKLKLVA